MALAIWTTACGTSPTPLPPPPTLAEVIEAIFLGSGTLADGDCGEPFGQWHSYPRGTTVTVLVGSTIDAEGESALAGAVADMQAAIGGRFALATQRALGPDPSPDLLQIASADVPDSVIQATCSPGASGCTRVVARDGAVYLSAGAIQRIGTSPRLKVHEFGHAVGLCHVNRERMPDAAMAGSPGTAAQPRFSALELEAVRTTYAAHLEPGATRAGFRNAGLIP